MHTHKENLLEENRGRVLYDIGIGNKFLYTTPFIQELKTTDKWDLIKLKGFYVARETISW